MMRLLAILANIGLLAALIYVLITQGLPSGRKNIVVTFAMGVAPLLSLAVILFGRMDNNYLALYYKRKSLEEQRRIDELKRDRHG
jgi:hypothetical protein